VNSSAQGTNGGVSEKILKLAKEQHMNTDIRRALFCIIISAEVWQLSYFLIFSISVLGLHGRVYEACQAVAEEAAGA